FVVLDMDENYEMPLILGRPFLATARSLIDVQQRKLILRVRDEKVVVKMDNDTLTLDDSLDNRSTLSEQSKLNLVEETELGVHPTTISNDSIGIINYKQILVTRK